MSRRFLAVLALALLVVVGLGCEAPPSVVVWHSYRGEEEKTLVALAKRYEAERGMHVELLALPFDAYTAKLVAAVPHAHGPDLFIDAHERLGIYRRENVVAPVGDALPDADVASYDPGAVDAVTLDGQRWAVPLSTKCLALYVDDDLVKQVPALEDIPAMRASLPPDVYPLAYEAENPYYHAAILSAFGGRLLDADASYGFIGPAAEQSLALVQRFIAEHAIPADTSGALVKQLFASGRAAMAIDGPWLAADLPAGLHYHVQPLPPRRDGAGIDAAAAHRRVGDALAVRRGASRGEGSRALARGRGVGHRARDRGAPGRHEPRGVARSARRGRQAPRRVPRAAAGRASPCPRRRGCARCGSPCRRRCEASCGVRT